MKLKKEINTYSYFDRAEIEDHASVDAAERRKLEQ